MTPTPTQPHVQTQTGTGAITAGQLLLDGEETVPGLVELLVSLGPVRAAATAAGLWPTGLEAIARDVAGAAQSLLGIKLSDALVDGWRTYRELVAAAQSTAASPGAVDRVALTTHQVSAVYRPYVEVLVDRRHVATVGFELQLLLTVDGLLARVSAGRLVAAEFARCTYAATLSCEGIKLAHREGLLNQGFEVPLGSGIALAEVES